MVDSNRSGTALGTIKLKVILAASLGYIGKVANIKTFVAQPPVVDKQLSQWSLRATECETCVLQVT